jgi:hypothetical protein
MQIFFIRNKIKKRKLINVDGECFVREKKSINRENLRIILTVFLCELIATLFITYVSRKHIFDIEIYKTYFIKRVNYENINNDKYCIYLFMEYIKEIVVLELLNFTKYKKIVDYLYLIYKTLTLSIALGIFVLIYGIVGQLKFALTLLPQGLIFYGFVYLFVKSCLKTDITYSKKNIGKILLYLFMGVMISFVTAFLESKFNLKIIYSIFRV